MPVKIDKGEDPLKRSGKAITIDGAFSEAYGDHGYTLVLEADRTFIGLHHHFESVDAAVREGVDIIPTIAVVRNGTPRRVADTSAAREIRRDRPARATGRGLSTNALRQEKKDGSARNSRLDKAGQAA